MQRKILPFLFSVFLALNGGTAFAKEYSNLESGAVSSHSEEFFVQTLGADFEGSLTKLKLKVTNIANVLYPSNFTLKEWSASTYKASNYVRAITPCSYDTVPECTGSACNGSAWAKNTEYTIELDFSCRNHTFDPTHYYALGIYSGNFGYSYKVVGSPTDSYVHGELKTGLTNFTADCYYGSNSTWGGWAYNQISTQTSICYADGNVADIYFEFTRPDSTPPTVNLTITPVTPDGLSDWYVTAPSITLNSPDADLEYIEYAWDGTSADLWNVYSSSLIPPEGEHVLYFRASDNNENVSDTQSYTVKTDITAPDVLYAISPSLPDGLNNWYVTTPTFSLSSSDTAAALLYSFDNFAWEIYSEVLNISDGKKNIYFKSQDAAGNESPTNSINLQVDTVAPVNVSSFKAKYDSESEVVRLSWKLASIEGIEKVETYKSTVSDFQGDYTKKIGSNLPADTDLTVKNVKKGDRYYFRAVTYDEAGNMSLGKSITFKVPRDKNDSNSSEEISGEPAVSTSVTVSNEPEKPEEIKTEVKTEAETASNEPETIYPEVLGIKSTAAESESPIWPYILAVIVLLIAAAVLFSRRKRPSGDSEFSIY